MANQKQKNARIIILFLIGASFFNYPLLSLFSSEEGTIFNIPLLYAFVYIVWFVIIGCTILTVGVHQDYPSSHTD